MPLAAAGSTEPYDDASAGFGIFIAGSHNRECDDQTSQIGTPWASRMLIDPARDCDSLPRRRRARGGSPGLSGGDFTILRPDSTEVVGHAHYSLDASGEMRCCAARTATSTASMMPRPAGAELSASVALRLWQLTSTGFMRAAAHP